MLAASALKNSALSLKPKGKWKLGVEGTKDCKEVANAHCLVDIILWASVWIFSVSTYPNFTPPAFYTVLFSLKRTPFSYSVHMVSVEHST